MFFPALGSARVSSVVHAASGILKGAQRHILVPREAKPRHSGSAKLRNAQDRGWM